MRPRAFWIGLGGLGLAACAAMPPATGGAAAASLAGTRWMSAADAADPQSRPRIEFAEGGRLAGFTGCNAMSGSWREEGGEARFGPVASTKRFCMGAAGETEKRVLAAFAEGARARREGERLVIVAPSGARYEFIPAATA